MLPLVGGHPALDLVNTVEPRLPAQGRHEHLAEPVDAITWALRAHLLDDSESHAVAAAWAASPSAAKRGLSELRQIREALSAVLGALLPADRAAAELHPASAAEGPGLRATSNLGASGDPGTSEPGTSRDPGASDVGASDDPDASDPVLELEYLSAAWAAAMTRSRLVPSRAATAVAELIVGSSAALLIPDRAAHAAQDLLRNVDPALLGTCPVADGGCGWLFIDRSRNGSRRWCAMGDCGSHAKAKRLTDRRRVARASYQ